MKKMIIVLTACCLVAGSGYAQSKKSGKKKADPSATEKQVPEAQQATMPLFQRTPNGLEYLILKDEPGPVAKEGDYIEMHIITRIGDSILFDSYKMNNNQPVPFQVQPAAFRGDIGEGFTLMSAGDSALFRVPVDSILNTGVQALPWMQKGAGMKLDYTVHVLSVKTAEQMKADVERESAAQKETDDQLLQAYFAEKKIKPLRTASGLYYTVNPPAKGAKKPAKDAVAPATGDSVSMNYTGKLLNGEVFDSNVDPEFQHVQPFWFVLGRRQVISGWDEGIALLPKGTKATLYLPSGLAYGAQSPSPRIPANSVLVFDVEVVDVRKAK